MEKTESKRAFDYSEQAIIDIMIVFEDEARRQLSEAICTAIHEDPSYNVDPEDFDGGETSPEYMLQRAREATVDDYGFFTEQEFDDLFRKDTDWVLVLEEAETRPAWHEAVGDMIVSDFDYMYPHREAKDWDIDEVIKCLAARYSVLPVVDYDVHDSPDEAMESAVYELVSRNYGS